jgi:ribulose-5-phosphate 4-epimerase/fuculose-1-phosphate aldolase
VIQFTTYASVVVNSDHSTTMNIPSMKERVGAEEWQLRCDLAACYRLIALHGWTDLVFTHISARVPGPGHRFLINPYGLLFDEITASSLVLIDQEGNKLQDSPFSVNRAGFVIHSAIHAVREDAGCVLHTHTRAGAAVAALKCGVLPLSQQATIVLDSIAYHDYEGIAVRDEEKPRLQADLDRANYLVLRNHGLLTVGPTVPDAFLSMYVFETACQIQISAQSAGEVITVGPEILAGVAEAVHTQTTGQGAALLWPALLRKLDRLDPTYRS